MISMIFPSSKASGDPTHIACLYVWVNKISKGSMSDLTSFVRLPIKVSNP